MNWFQPVIDINHGIDEKERGILKQVHAHPLVPAESCVGDAAATYGREAAPQEAQNSV
jgi:hypothetical protein